MNNKKQEEIVVQEDVKSLKGTLFSTIVFVGGGLISFMVTLFGFYMTRL
ncbi:MAG TPA: hypothetical protein VK037_03865 [Pseudogracilibacillus sp.]|nr:hypothetical protein [Pseudogracilibacillus sp.]